MIGCYLCLNKCFKKWAITYKEGNRTRTEYVCRRCGMIWGAEKVTVTTIKFPKFIDPIKQAEDLGYQVTMEN